MSISKTTTTYIYTLNISALIVAANPGTDPLLGDTVAVKGLNPEYFEDQTIQNIHKIKIIQILMSGVGPTDKNRSQEE